MGQGWVASFSPNRHKLRVPVHSFLKIIDALLHAGLNAFGADRYARVEELVGLEQLRRRRSLALFSIALPLTAAIDCGFLLKVVHGVHVSDQRYRLCQD